MSTIMKVKGIPETEWVSRWPELRLDQLIGFGITELNIELLDRLNVMCKFAQTLKNWKHSFNSAYRRGDPGQHGLGNAVDMYFCNKKPGDAYCLDQYLFALRFGFNGIGVYPFWNTPGIHVDVRPIQDFKALWLRQKNGTYITGDNIGGIFIKKDA